MTLKSKLHNNFECGVVLPATELLNFSDSFVQLMFVTSYTDMYDITWYYGQRVEFTTAREHSLEFMNQKVQLPLKLYSESTVWLSLSALLYWINVVRLYSLYCAAVVPRLCCLHFFFQHSIWDSFHQVCLVLILLLITFLNSFVNQFVT